MKKIHSINFNGLHRNFRGLRYFFMQVKRTRAQPDPWSKKIVHAMQIPAVFFKIFWLFWIFHSLIHASIANAGQDVWEVLRGEFRLNHEVSRVEVQEQIRWFTTHPAYLQKVCHQSEPYIYHILDEIKKRKLPGELALLPMIESSYNPFAYSGAGAAGLWQLMPGTGSDLGLKQDWWIDGRRSIRGSTNAALTYLLYLNKFFNGNWILAIAAYDAGEGTLTRALQAAHASGQAHTFWGLPVPRETQLYVPRLLALAELFQNPGRYNVILPEIPYLPYFEEVNIGSPIDLNHAANMAGISYKELIQLNPGFNRWTTAPYKPVKLLIPSKKVRQFNLNLAHLPENKRVSWEKHQVLLGDSLDTIAIRYHTTVGLIKQLNQLSTNRIWPNQFLLIPSSKNTPMITQKKPTYTSIPFEYKIATARNYRMIHIVQDQDTYQKLVTTYGVRIQDIQLWNQLSPEQSLHKGQQLVIWKKMNQPIAYVLKTGDTLSALAQQYQTKIQRILALNPGIKSNMPLHAGQKIFIG